MTDLQHDLAQLTADQPVQRPDRVEAVLSRSRRLRRRRRIAVAVAAVVLASPLSLLVSTGTPPPAPLSVATPADRWPDRSVRGDTARAEGALSAYRALGSVTEVRWLYRGTVPLADDKDVFVAVFLATRNGVPQLVVSRARTQEIGPTGMGTEPRARPWHAGQRPAGLLPDQVGVYVNLNNTDQNELLVLSSPTARRLDWRQQPLPSSSRAIPDVGRAVTSGDTASADGVFTVPVGVLAGPVSTVSRDGQGTATRELPLDPELSPPSLTLPEPPGLPAGFYGKNGGFGSTEQQADGSWRGEDVGIGTEPPARQVAIVRCYGGGRLGLAIEDRLGVAQSPASYAACDGRTHRLLLKARFTGRPVSVAVRSDRLQAYFFETSIP